ncbi:Cysteine dioxygenase [Balamuthia mandrillaris]
MEQERAIWLLFRLLDTGLRLHEGNEEDAVELCSKQLRLYAGRHTDWQKYSFFSDLHYTRNLIDDNDMLEMMVLCWAPGQVSRIHDHADSHCFMGSVMEKRYSKVAATEDEHRLINEEDEPTPVPGSCPELKFLGETKLEAGGEAVHIHNRLWVHSVGNYSEEPAITLHIYSPPIKRVKIFDMDSNQVIARTPGFFSVHGRKTGKS